MAVKSLETGLVPPGAEPARDRSRARRAEPVARRSSSGPLRAATRRGLRLPDQHDAAALGPAARRPTPRSRRARLRLPDRRPGSLERLARAQAGAEPKPELEIVRRTLRAGATAAPGEARAHATPPRPCASRRSRPPSPRSSCRSRRPRRSQLVPVPGGRRRRRRRARPGRGSACSPSSPSRPATRADMLELDLDLEADLGIDTVKQAEVFAADPRELGHRARSRPQAARLQHPRQDDRVRLRPPSRAARSRARGCSAAALPRGARPPRLR